VCDQFKAHITEATDKIVKGLSMQLPVFPGDPTSELQPLDISVNKPFKAFMREGQTKWMVTPTV
jgi:hypothetical protein